jgi:hypothetical protein
VEGQLDAAAETRPVDRGDGRKRQRTQTREELVARTCACNRALARDARKLGHVRSGREEERLPRDQRRAEVAAFELL